MNDGGVRGAGCWVPVAGCWVLGAGCWVPGAGCWVLGAGKKKFQVQCFKFQVSGVRKFNANLWTEDWELGTGNYVLGTEDWVLQMPLAVPFAIGKLRTTLFTQCSMLPVNCRVRAWGMERRCYLPGATLELSTGYEVILETCTSPSSAPEYKKWNLKHET
jgi:hypothetical protein